ncbi:hypothetical protein Tco_1465000 [Tanacetum coccineum]
MAPESSQVVVISKFDMHIHTSTLTTKELKEAITEYCIPTDLHPRLPSPELTMDNLPPNVIGIYIEQLEQGGLRIHLSTFFPVRLGFNSFEASSSGTKEIKFMKAQKKTSSDGGPITMSGPQNVQAAPKAITGPPPVGTPGSEKSMSFQKSILGPRPKHIIVRNIKVPVASDVVKQIV